MENNSVQNIPLETEQNVQFSDDGPQKSIEYANPTFASDYEVANQAGTTLTDFLKRPVEIYHQVWAVGSDFTPFRISPWEKYLTSTLIADKLKTFKLLRGTLHIKILVNGSPFHYGRVFVGMRPSRFNNCTYDSFLPSTSYTIENYFDGVANQTWQPAKTFYSQRPHVFVNPAQNEPTHIHWPFMAATDWLEVNKQAEYDRLGFLEIWVMNTLRHANGATDSVDISFYAWMDNVEICGATSLFVEQNDVFDIVEQNDEHNEDGPVSKPATAIANAASILSEIPVIGKYAKATEIGARVVGSIAAMFGYSKPVLIDKQYMVTRNQFGRMATIEGHDPIIKLSLTEKQELSISPSVAGLRLEDELAFLRIARTEALIAQFPWNVGVGSHAVGRVFGCRVKPTLAPSFFQTDPEAIVHTVRTMTPVRFVAQAFEKWTGSLVFRIQIVCSQMHRGRLAVVYTPDCDANHAYIGRLQFPQHYTHIIDISKETDASFEVNWAQPEAWRLIDNNTQADVNVNNIGNFADTEYECNGKLEIFVINKLGAPTDAADVEVNVFIRAGDSFNVAAPRSIGRYAWNIDGGNYDLVEQADSAYVLGSNEDDPQHTLTYPINGNSTATADTRVYMGETIGSIRSMLKRYCYQRLFFINEESGFTNTINVIDIPDFPSGRSSFAYSNSGVDDFGTLNSPSAMTYLRYYCQGFVGWRGAIRYKAFYTASSVTTLFGVMRGASIGVNTSRSFSNVNKSSPLASEINDMQNNCAYLESTRGSVIVPLGNSASIEYELPFYSVLRYGELHSPNTGIYSEVNRHHSLLASTTAPTESIAYFVAAGEDLTFFFFIGAPPFVDEYSVILGT